MGRDMVSFKKKLKSKHEKRKIFCDSTMIKVHHNGCGAIGGNDTMGRTRGGNNSKITICCDELMIPLHIRINQGNCSDMRIGEMIVKEIECDEFVADKGYDSDKIRMILEDRNIQSTIPYRRNRKDIKEIDKESYKERNIIERFFLRIKKFRRIATRFEKNADNFMNIVLIGCVCLMIGI